MGIKENSIPHRRAGPLARVYMKNFPLTYVGSRLNQIRFQQDGLGHFSFEHTMFFIGVS